MDYQEAIKYLEYRKEFESMTVSSMLEGKTARVEAYEIAISAMQELERYHQLGTLEELEQLKENNLSGIELAGIACAINQLQKYEQLGTLQEVRFAVEEHRRSIDDLK